jgi:hypothetical protein
LSSLLLFVLKWTAPLALPLAQTGLAEQQRTSLSFIFTDDHAYQAISCYGSALESRLRISMRIASAGMRFESLPGNQFDLRGPSRRRQSFPENTRTSMAFAKTERFDGSQVTFPKLLQQVGYQTGGDLANGTSRLNQLDSTSGWCCPIKGRNG